MAGPKLGLLSLKRPPAPGGRWLGCPLLPTAFHCAKAWLRPPRSSSWRCCWEGEDCSVRPRMAERRLPTGMALWLAGWGGSGREDSGEE